MAVVWIITIGNSDVKLTSKNQWGDLRQKKREQLQPCYRDFQEPTEEAGSLFSLPARVMGIVYSDALETHWDHFCFPLLSEFVKKIKADKKNKLDRVIVLLTNQEGIFPEDNNTNPQYDRSDPDCPFWKDTCKLEPILQRFLNQELGEVNTQFHTLEAKTIRDGLDNWDSTLQLVKQQFEQWEISKSDRVIVSHQAGTPAISSGVQLTALLKFGKKVQFLVSNEFTRKVDLLPASSYFSTLQIQEAQQLLKRFDYSGVKRALDKIDFNATDKQEKLSHLVKLLDLCELWNAAKFDEFAQKIGASASRSTTWWWKGYEMAYLAWIRMFQENPTEALFHSVRAIEGLICEWAIEIHSQHIRYKFFKLDHNGERKIEFHFNRFKDGQEGSPVAQKTIDSRFEANLYGKQIHDLHKNKLGLHGQVLYSLFRATFACPDGSSLETQPIKIVWEQLADERNELFHRLKGIAEKEVYEAWGCKKREQWGQLLFDCIQLVSNTKEQNFKSLKQGSLITPIHQELEDGLNQLLLEEQPV
jgi:hypothetical protein